MEKLAEYYTVIQKTKNKYMYMYINITQDSLGHMVSDVAWGHRVSGTLSPR